MCSKHTGHFNSGSNGVQTRYEVMDKLVNFMAPTSVELAPAAQQLLARLFGVATRPLVLP